MATVIIKEKEYRVLYKSYLDIEDARNNLTSYFQFYNDIRPHQSLNYRAPAEVYFKDKKSTTKLQESNRRNPSNLSTITV